MIAALHRSLEQELLALARGASLECLVCGEFVLREGDSVRCPECGMGLASEVGVAGSQLDLGLQAG